MPRPRLPFRRRNPAEPSAEPPTEPASAAPQAPADPGAAPPAASPAPQARPNPHERIDGLRAWVAQLDRKLGVRTYVGTAIAILALAAAAVALVLILSLKQDAATEDDVSALRDQLSGVERSASAAAQKSAQSLDQRLTELEAKVNRISADQTTARRELHVVQDDIKELRSQSAASGGQSAGGGSGRGASLSPGP